MMFAISCAVLFGLGWMTRQVLLEDESSVFDWITFWVLLAGTACLILAYTIDREARIQQLGPPPAIQWQVPRAPSSPPQRTTNV